MVAAWARSKASSAEAEVVVVETAEVAAETAEVAAEAVEVAAENLTASETGFNRPSKTPYLFPRRPREI